MPINYLEWLQAGGQRLYYAGGLAWRLYRRALIPALPFPCLAELSRDEAQQLLRESGAMFVRFSSGPVDAPTEWWYIVADAYDMSLLSGNTRSKIRRGLRRHVVRQLGAAWLARHGYRCYCSAHARYRHARPVPEPAFRSEVLAQEEGPFEHWGVFAGDTLVGHSSCVVEGGSVFTDSITLDPIGLRDYSAYALFDSLLSHYVTERGMVMSNGTRSVSHDTEMQDFLLRFGYRRLYARLHIVYQPRLQGLVNTLYRFRHLLRRLPDAAGLHAIKSVIYQESLHRACCCLESRVAPV